MSPISQKLVEVSKGAKLCGIHLIYLLRLDNDDKNLPIISCVSDNRTSRKKKHTSVENKRKTIRNLFEGSDHVLLNVLSRCPE